MADISREKLNLINSRHLRPNRSWIDLFSLSLSTNFIFNYFDLTTLIDNLSEDEVIIIDSHDNIFEEYQIHYWDKDRIPDILPAIKCPSFKSETKIFKISEMDEIGNFIYDQNHTKSIMIENADDTLSISLVYGDTVKITSRTLDKDQHYNFFDKLKERYKLWEIEDCTCKPKKIRVEVKGLINLKNTIEEIERISDINDAKFRMLIYFNIYNKPFSNYEIMVFSHSSKLMSDKETNLIFTGDSLAVVSKGDYYNFRLDEWTMGSELSYIKGKI